MKCKTCKWFDPLGTENESNGLCRVNPPTVVGIHARVGEVSDGRAHTAWPYVRSTDRCGLHAPAEAMVKR
jgi:hypothetical protein